MLLKLSRFFLYASLFSVLIVLSGTFFPFIGGKYYFFRVAVELSLAFFILSLAFEQPSKRFMETARGIISRPIFIAVSAFVFAYLLSALLAYDPYAAFWSNYERGEGAFQMLHYYIFFVLMMFLFRSSSDWQMAFKLSLVAAVGIIFYGLLAQAVFLTPGLNVPIEASGRENGYKQLLIFVGPLTGGEIPESRWVRLTAPRFQGSLGNPSYVSPYLMFSLFYLSYLFAARKNAIDEGERKKRRERYAWIVIGIIVLLYFLWVFLRMDAVLEAVPDIGALGEAIISAFLVLAALVFTSTLFIEPSSSAVRWALFILFAFFIFTFFILTQTRGAFLGLGAAIFAFLLYLLWSFPRGRKWTVVALVVIVATGSMLVAFRHSPTVQQIPGARFLEIFDLGIQSQTVQTRLWTWNSAWRGFLERPIFGWGPENFSIVFDKYFDPRHYQVGKNSETWFDRAHSIVFDYMAETGIIGFLSYASVFVVFYLQFFRRRRRTENSANAFQNALLFAIPIGYLVQGLALFDVLPIYINLFLFLAFASYLFSAGKMNPPQ